MKNIIIISIVSLILLTGCNNNQPLTPQEVVTMKVNFSFPEEFNNEYKIIEGTENNWDAKFDKQTGIVVEDKVYYNLTYRNTSDRHEEIQFSNIEKLEEGTFESYLINTLPNRNLMPKDKENYLAELKSAGWQNITTGEREIWVSGLGANLQGYESNGWILNKKTKDILPVLWILIDDINVDPAVDQEYAQEQYDKFIEITKIVKF